MRKGRVAWLLLGVALVLVGGGAVVAHWLFPPPPLWQDYPSSVAVFDRRGALLRLSLAADGQYRLWTPLPDMDPRMQKAILLQEDRYFWVEPGVNPVSLLRAAWKTYGRHASPQGGSTISMQLARILWQLDTRRPWGKLVQIIRALELELRYSKTQILEAYLNFAPFGANIQGVEAASWIYFHHSSSKLTLAETLTLAVLPQNPVTRGRVHAGHANQSLLRARTALFARWCELHPKDRGQRSIMALPFRLGTPRELPFVAPWFVDTLLWENGGVGVTSLGRMANRLHGTLDAQWQRLLQRILQQYVAAHRHEGLQNGAVLMVDCRDMGVRALVGSADFWKHEISGQVDGTRARRSPGSTLKPFIYGLGFDQGVITPATVLHDVPSSFGPYSPENFDGRFDGPITVTQALIRSRNIPAIEVAARLSHPSFYQFLQAAGVQGLAPENHYGLALVLGGAELSAQELATLYAMLANGGRWQPLRWIQQGQQPKDVPALQLLSPEASFLVLDILRQNPPPAVAQTGQATPLPVAWKTGTSSGFRDAWTVGIVGPYVLLVWLGNFDGSPNSALVGGEMAAPLFFRIVAALQAADPKLPVPNWQPPPRLRSVEICQSSGALPTRWCPRRGKTWFIPGVSPIAVDTVYRPLWVDKSTGKPLCPPVDPRRAELRVFAYWPSDLQEVFARAGTPRSQPPAPPRCLTQGETALPPKILTPKQGVVYTLQRSHPERSQILLKARSDAAVQRLYWFVDQHLVQSVAAGEEAWWTPPGGGRFQLRVIDDQGQADERELQVVQVP